MDIDGKQIKPATIPADRLVAAIQNPIQSEASGVYKKILSLAYDPDTGNFLVTYES